MRNNISKVKGKYLIFKTNITEVQTRLLVDNGNEAKLIDKSFMRANKIPSFKLKKAIYFTFGNSKVV